MAAGGKLHKTFCDNLRAARRRAGLTQEEVARKLKMPRPQYTQIESGRFQPSFSTLERVAPILRVTPHELLDPDFAAELVG